MALVYRLFLCLLILLMVLHPGAAINAPQKSQEAGKLPALLRLAWASGVLLPMFFLQCLSEGSLCMSALLLI